MAYLTFSPRQMEAWRLLCEGLQDGEIAFRMQVSHKRVRQYLQRISQKLGFPGVNRAWLVRAGCAPFQFRNTQIGRAKERASQKGKTVVY